MIKFDIKGINIPATGPTKRQAISITNVTTFMMLSSSLVNAPEPAESIFKKKLKIEINAPNPFPILYCQLLKVHLKKIHLSSNRKQH